MECFVCNNKKDFTPLFPGLCLEKNYLCNKCGLVFIPHNESYMSDYYERDGYFKHSPNIALKKIFVSKNLLRKQGFDRMKNIVSMVDIDLHGKSVLDVGCGYGEILFNFKKYYNCNVLGVEPSIETAKKGGDFFDIDIAPTLLEKLDSKNKFDLIICNHTLEHVDDPEKFISKFISLLSEDGHIYIEVPNILKPTGNFSLNTFLYREHLQTFSRFNLYQFLSRLGFCVCRWDDKNFVRFVCSLNNHGELIVPELSARTIIDFMRDYAKKYNFFSVLKVNFFKLIYLFKLVCYKCVDLSENTRNN